MKHPIQVSLLVALAATALPALLPAPASAQFAKTPRKFAAHYEIAPLESVDAGARTVSIRRADLLKPERSAAPNDVMRVPLSRDARLERLEFSLGAGALRIGDTVSIVEPNPDGSPRGAAPLLPIFDWRSSARLSGSTNQLKVVSLSPLTLRSGVLPAGADFRTGRRLVLHSGAYSNRVGFIWLGTGDDPVITDKIVQIGAQGKVGLVTQNRTFHSSRTIEITRPEALEFDRLTPIDFAEVAAQMATGEVVVSALLSGPSRDKFEVQTLTVRSKN